jgi:hypothetical protein
VDKREPAEAFYANKPEVFTSTQTHKDLIQLLGAIVLERIAVVLFSLVCILLQLIVPVAIVTFSKVLDYNI